MYSDTVGAVLHHVEIKARCKGQNITFLERGREREQDFDEQQRGRNFKNMKKILTALVMGFFVIGINAQADPVLRSVRFEAQSEAEMNAIPSNKLQEGSVCYREDTDSLWRYNGVAWAEMSGSELSDLSDVNTSTATNRNVLVADGTDWESRALVEADISDLGSYVNATTLTPNISAVGITAGSTVTLDYSSVYVENRPLLRYRILKTTSGASSTFNIDTFANEPFPQGTYFIVENGDATDLILDPVSGVSIIGPNGVALGDGVAYSVPSNSTGILTVTGTNIWTYQNTGPTNSGSSFPVDADEAIIQDETDNTKQIDWDLSGITTSTKHTITMPDADVDLGNLPTLENADQLITSTKTITVDGASTQLIIEDGTGNTWFRVYDTGAEPMFPNGVRSDLAPTLDNELTNKQYVDDQIAGVSYPSTAQQYLKSDVTTKKTLADSDFTSAANYKGAWFNFTANDTILLGDDVGSSNYDKPIVVVPMESDSLYIKANDNDFILPAGSTDTIVGFIAKNREPISIQKISANYWYLIGKGVQYTEAPLNLFDSGNAVDTESEANTSTDFSVDSGPLTISTTSTGANVQDGLYAVSISHGGPDNTAGKVALDISSECSASTTYTIQVYVQRGAGSTGNWQIDLETGWTLLSRNSSLISVATGESYEVYTLVGTTDGSGDYDVIFEFNSNADDIDVMYIDSVKVFEGDQS